MSPPLALFTSFPCLLTELRLKILEKATDNIEPRLVNLSSKVKGNNIPALLHGCHESRVEARKTSSRCIITPANSKFPYPLFIDYTSDSVHLNYHEPLDFGSPSALREFDSVCENLVSIQWRQVRKLVLSVEGSGLFDRRRAVGWKFGLWCVLLRSRPNLLELNIILDPSWGTARTVTGESQIPLADLPGSEYMDILTILQRRRAYMKEQLMLCLRAAQANGKFLALKLRFMEYGRAGLREVTG